MKKAVAGMLFAMCCTLSTTAVCETWRGRMAVDLAVPDIFSVKDAREMALKRLKLKAANQAGSVVIHRQTLQEDKISDVVEVIAATEAKVENIQESVRSEGDNLFVKMEADVQIDLDALEKNVSLVKENEAMKAQLKDLGGRYRQALGRTYLLPSDLEWINKWENNTGKVLSGKSIVDHVAELNSRRAGLRSELESRIEPFLRATKVTMTMKSAEGYESLVKKEKMVYITADVHVTFDTARWLALMKNYFIINNPVPNEFGLVKVDGIQPEWEPVGEELYGVLMSKYLEATCGYQPSRTFVTSLYVGKPDMTLGTWVDGIGELSPRNLIADRKGLFVGKEGGITIKNFRVHCRQSDLQKLNAELTARFADRKDDVTFR